MFPLHGSEIEDSAGDGVTNEADSSVNLEHVACQARSLKVLGEVRLWPRTVGELGDLGANRIHEFAIGIPRGEIGSTP